MITQADLAHWRHTAPWPTDEQIEQDLTLSRLIVEISNHPLLGQELVFRGGTCFHKLWLERPWRYSEDLDYVRRTDGGVGPVLDAIREVASIVGFDDVKTYIGQQPKARLISTTAAGGPLRIKIEMNTFERSPAQPTVTRPFAVDSPWFTGHANVPTFTIEELIATKIRALFQRRKGRDLFDLWLAVEEAGVSPADIAACFEPYRPEGWTVTRALDNLDRNSKTLNSRPILRRSFRAGPTDTPRKLEPRRHGQSSTNCVPNLDGDQQRPSSAKRRTHWHNACSADSRS